MIDRMVDFKDADLAVLNKILQELDRRLSKIDKTVPTAHVAASTHSVPIVIGGTTYYLLLTTVAP